MAATVNAQLEGLQAEFTVQDTVSIFAMGTRAASIVGQYMKLFIE